MNRVQDDFWTDRTVLVTGCTGLLGSWLTEVLTCYGANVVGLVRDQVPQSRLVQSGGINRINVVRGEVEDYPLLERVINEYQVQTVFHLAAQTIVGIANASPLATFETNVRGSWNLLEACRKSSWVENVVVASSDKAYGEHPQLPYSEDASLIGRHPYDVSKSCADLIAQAYFSSYQLSVCITRFGNLFGPGDLNFNRLIPGTIRSALRGEAPVIRSNGKFSRDYIYVEDAADAYAMLAKKMASEPKLAGNAFNFSYEAPLSALEVVNKILNEMDKGNLEPQILDIAQNEIPHQYLSSKKALEMLDWQPQYHFNEGLTRTIPWYEDWLKEPTAQ